MFTFSFEKILKGFLWHFCSYPKIQNMGIRNLGFYKIICFLQTLRLSDFQMAQNGVESGKAGDTTDR